MTPNNRAERGLGRVEGGFGYHHSGKRESFFVSGLLQASYDEISTIQKALSKCPISHPRAFFPIQELCQDCPESNICKYSSTRLKFWHADCL